MHLMNLIILFIDTKYISFCITAEELNENCCEQHKIKLAKNDLTISSFFNMATYRETKIDQKMHQVVGTNQYFAQRRVTLHRC